MFVRNMGMYPLLFFVFFVVFGLLLDIPVSELVMKICRGNDSLANIVVISIFAIISYIFVKLFGPAIVDFLEIIFRTEFIRTYN